MPKKATSLAQFKRDLTQRPDLLWTADDLKPLVRELERGQLKMFVWENVLAHDVEEARTLAKAQLFEWTHYELDRVPETVTKPKSFFVNGGG